MTGYKKLSIKKGPKRITVVGGEPEIRQTYFCPECGKRVKTDRIQKPDEQIGFVCNKVELHKSGHIYFWPLDNVRVHQRIDTD